MPPLRQVTRKYPDLDSFFQDYHGTLAHGALLVSGVETVWSGVEIPAYADAITRKDYRGKGIALERFAEMARFNYGSTVIVLLPRGAAMLAAGLAAETPVRLGQRLATRA